MRETVNYGSCMNDVPISPTGMMHLLHCAIVIDMAWRSSHGTAGQDKIRLQKQSTQHRQTLIDGYSYSSRARKVNPSTIGNDRSKIQSRLIRTLGASEIRVLMLYLGLKDKHKLRSITHYAIMSPFGLYCTLAKHKPISGVRFK